MLPHFLPEQLPPFSQLCSRTKGTRAPLPTHPFRPLPLNTYTASTDTDAAGIRSLQQVFPAVYQKNAPHHSGKMRCLQLLLGSILGQDSADKVVIVSNSTAALDLVQALCNQQSYSMVRIDGATDVNKRQDIVNSFNLYGTAQVRDSCHTAQFLLSLTVVSLSCCN